MFDSSGLLDDGASKNHSVTFVQDGIEVAKRQQQLTDRDILYDAAWESGSAQDSNSGKDDSDSSSSRLNRATRTGICKSYPPITRLFYTADLLAEKSVISKVNDYNKPKPYKNLLNPEVMWPLSLKSLHSAVDDERAEYPSRDK